MASKENKSTATDKQKQTDAAAANSECIMGRLVQFLVSPSLTEDFIECLVSAGEKTSRFHGQLSRETLRDNVKNIYVVEVKWSSTCHLTFVANIYVQEVQIYLIIYAIWFLF